MVFFRLVFGLLLLASLVCFGAYVLSGQTRWRRLGLLILKWTVLAGLGFFAGLLLEHFAG